MAIINAQQQQTIHRNFSSVVEFLDRKFSRSQIYLQEVPSYIYKGRKAKLEVTVFSNPQIGKVDIRLIKLKNYDREPAFECSYDLSGLSMGSFTRHIDDLISKLN